MSKPCQQCGANESNHIKHLPLPGGGNGHITLTNWMDLCQNCIKQNSVAFTEAINAARQYAKGREHSESEQG